MNRLLSIAALALALIAAALATRALEIAAGG